MSVNIKSVTVEVAGAYYVEVKPKILNTPGPTGHLHVPLPPDPDSMSFVSYDGNASHPVIQDHKHYGVVIKTKPDIFNSKHIKAIRTTDSPSKILLYEDKEDYLKIGDRVHFDHNAAVDFNDLFIKNVHK